MKYHELNMDGHKAPNRVGRGIAAGRGKTAGRGTKGQMSRTGSRKRPGFEGGQNPLMQRLPKLRGFRSMKQPATVIYTDQLAAVGNKVITNAVLAEAGLISSAYVAVKVLHHGKVGRKVSVQLQGASKAAVEAIVGEDGSFEKVSRPSRPKLAKDEPTARRAASVKAK